MREFDAADLWKQSFHGGPLFQSFDVWLQEITLRQKCPSATNQRCHQSSNFEEWVASAYDLMPLQPSVWLQGLAP